MIKNKKILSLIIFLMLSLNSNSKENISIVYKINNEIITNIDINKERRYLIVLNAELKTLDEVQLINISKNSIIREKIKKIELLKYFDIEKSELDIEEYLKNIYKTLNIMNESEFDVYLGNNDLSLDYFKEKIRIEIFWNQLIYEKYINLININENILKDKLNKIQNKEQEKVFFLSEIVFEIETNNTYEKKKRNIEKSINEIGFNNTANIYSISDSSKLGGKIGWIEEQKLSKNILEKLSSLNVGQTTQPIQVGSNFLILNIEEIKYEKMEIDEKEILKKMIQFETNKKLDQFSKIYYKQVELNQKIDEL
ncbi:peptidylprolyl isomerase [Candidatus Pelagibacter sp.]|nr:peptidylprolyl isomerase [Candidatus Pelagibacter sp.]